MDEQDHYGVLGVSPASEDIVIRAAFLALIRKYHPDQYVGSTEEGNRRSQEINAAYSELSDPDKRARYDERRQTGKSDRPNSREEFAEDVTSLWHPNAEQLQGLFRLDATGRQVQKAKWVNAHPHLKAFFANLDEPPVYCPQPPPTQLDPDTRLVLKIAATVLALIGLLVFVTSKMKDNAVGQQSSLPVSGNESATDQQSVEQAAPTAKTYTASLIKDDRNSPTVTQCDVLAESASDPQRVAPGLDKKDIKAVEATKACKAALLLDPDNARLWWELHRALYKSGALTDAFDACLKAANRGYIAAEYDLGVSFERGEGVAKDEAQAVAWYRKAANQGDALAEFNLGIMYVSGRGVAKDEAKAASWYRKASDQGLADAQINLGALLVDRDEARAVELFRKAAAQGDEVAVNNLAVIAAQSRTQSTPNPETKEQNDEQELQSLVKDIPYGRLQNTCEASDRTVPPGLTGDVLQSCLADAKAQRAYMGASVWKQVEADNGAVFQVDIGNARRDAVGAEAIIKYPDNVIEHLTQFDCQGHYRDVNAGFPVRSVYAPPRSVMGTIATMVCTSAK